MPRQLLGNIRGPQGLPGEPGEVGPPGLDGQDGVDGRDAELEVYNTLNMVEPHHTRSTVNGDVTIIDGVETFSSTGTTINTHLIFEHQYTLSQDHVYTISFDVFNDGVVDMDNIWIINTDGSHSNYSIHPENRHMNTNLFGVPQNERFRCFITFKPQRDLVGHLRVGSNRGTGNTGSTQISRVSLTQSYDTALGSSIKGFADGRYALVNLPSNETTNLSVYSFSSNTDNIKSIGGGVLELGAGRYLFNYNGYIVNGTGNVALRLNVNGSLVAYYRGRGEDSMTLSQVLNVKQGDQIELTINYSGAEGSFATDTRTRLTITEL